MTDKRPYSFDLVKPGAILHLHCGGTLPVKTLAFCDSTRQFSTNGLSWRKESGYYEYFSAVHPLTIVAITPAPEPKRLNGFLNIYFGLTATQPCETKQEADRKSIESRIACLDLSQLFDKDGNPICEGHGL